MRIVLEIESAALAQIARHLLPLGSEQEQAAFLFATRNEMDGITRFKVIDTRRLASRDFVRQEEDYLEMADTTRIGLIKKALDLDASLVEIHSHLSPFPARFSEADRFGLQETVPHMWWRLGGRPYLAIVVAPSGFDALVWLNDPTIPCALDAVVAGDSVLRPTGFSLGDWN